jgi:hypothetical protein
MCSAFYVLCTVNYILCTVNYILCTVYKTCLESLSPKIHPFMHALDILIKTVNSYYSIALATLAAQTTLRGRPSQALQSNITQESQVALTG